MAIIDYNYMSHALMHPTTVKVILPEVGKASSTMYFLHGAVCDAKNCTDNVDMQNISDKYNIAIVIPNGGNSFYIDHGVAYGDYGKFVGKELVDVTRNEFGLSKNREDTAIAGFSMGGYGAIRNGVKYNSNFGYVIALSAACLYEKSAYRMQDTRFGYFKEHLFDKVFKEKSIPGPYSENYRYLIQKRKEERKPLPKFYLACGTNDDLIILNNEFCEFLSEMHVDYCYVKDEGEHNWELWKRQVEPAVKWFVENET